MKRSQPIFISVSNPCREDWQQMSPSGRERFCASCQKTVIDFSTWTDTALYEFFKMNTGPVCGRFQNTQLNRDIKIPPQPKSRLYRLAIACGLTLMFTQLPDVHARVKAPVEILSETPVQKDSTGNCDDCPSLKVMVRDENSEPLIGAVVFLMKNAERIGGGITNIDGEICFQKIDTGAYDIIATFPGYRTQNRKITVVQNHAEVNITFESNRLDYLIMGFVAPLIEKPLEKKPGG